MPRFALRASRFALRAARSAPRTGGLVPALLLILAFAPAAVAQQSPPPSSSSWGANGGQAPSPCLAPPPVPHEERELIQQLLKRVNELEAQVKALQAERAKSGSPMTASVQLAAQVAGEEAPVERQLREEPRGLQIRGFGDIAFKTSDRKGSTSSFALGQLDLFITSRLSEKLSVLNENTIEADAFVPETGAAAHVAHAGGGARNSIGIDIERLLLQYSVNEYLNVAFGRFHTGIGYYNTAYHHGVWLETATSRPFLFAFEHEGGIVPTHNVGLQITGGIPSGALGLRYLLEIGNGRASRSSTDVPVQNAIDENNGKSLNIGLIARPDGVPGLQTGLSVYLDRLKPEQLPSIRETITAAHVVYLTPLFEWLNEGVLIHHSPRGARRKFNTLGFYTQIARQFGKIRPYFRYQYVNASKNEPIFPEVGLRHGPSVGLRYDADESTAFKLQYDHTFRGGRSSVNELTLQSAFTF